MPVLYNWCNWGYGTHYTLDGCLTAHVSKKHVTASEKVQITIGCKPLNKSLQMGERFPQRC